MIHRRLPVAVLFAVMLFACALCDPAAVITATADESPLPTTTLSSTERFRLRTIDDVSVEGLVTLLDGGEIVIKSPNDAVVRKSIDDLLSLDRQDQTAVMTEPDAIVLLTNGDCLVGMTTSISDDLLTMEWTGRGDVMRVSIPQEFVRAVLVDQPDDEADRIRLQRQWALQETNADLLLLTAGTYADGELVSLIDGTITMTTSLGQLESKVEEASTIILNAQLATQPPTPSRFAVLLLTDGSRLTVDSLTLNDGQLVGHCVVGPEVSVPLDRLLSARFFGDRVASLAHQEPADYQFTPYLTESHPLVTHRNVHGGRLRLRGTDYVVGLGMHSQSAVSYDLTVGDYQTFTTTIGIDDMTRGQGDVIFAVEVDSQRVYESPRVTGKLAPITVGPIDVSRASRLTLIVEFGQSGNILDIADWCDPVLLR